MGNEKPSIEEAKIIQWLNEKGQKDKNDLQSMTQNPTDRVKRT